MAIRTETRWDYHLVMHSATLTEWRMVSRSVWQTVIQMEMQKENR